MATYQPFPNLTLRDLLELLRGELDDAENGVTWGADHHDTIRTVHDRLTWLIEA